MRPCCEEPAPVGPAFLCLFYWGWFEEPGPILSEVFSKPMGQVKLVWWEYPIFGHVFSKLMGQVKLVWWEYPVFEHVYSNLME